MDSVWGCQHDSFCCSTRSVPDRLHIDQRPGKRSIDREGPLADFCGKFGEHGKDSGRTD